MLKLFQINQVMTSCANCTHSHLKYYKRVGFKLEIIIKLFVSLTMHGS